MYSVQYTLMCQEKHLKGQWRAFQASVPPPTTKEGGTHLPACERVGESQFGQLEKKLNTLPTLCNFLYFFTEHCMAKPSIFNDS